MLTPVVGSVERKPFFTHDLFALVLPPLKHFKETSSLFSTGINVSSWTNGIHKTAIIGHIDCKL
jgi:hypothetical protein